MEISIKPVGKAETCFKEKFGIPRQPGLAPSSWGKVILLAPYNRAEALNGLEEFSHLILTFVPHQSQKQRSPLSVRPPRLGGNKKLGVFATRSPYRPNPICTSVVKLEQVNVETGEIFFSNHDLLDGTPIIDIKPYIPQWDIIQQANDGWLKNHEEEKFQVTFKADLNLPNEQKKLITELLSLNPKPRYQIEKEEYGLRIGEWDVIFKYLNDREIEVINFIPFCNQRISAQSQNSVI